jgi:predicted secreted hydrolase
MRLVIGVIVLLTVSGIAISGFVWLGLAGQPDLEASVVNSVPTIVEDDQFERAYEARPIIFPKDLGAHETFQTEWWYYTGNLADEAGNRYGFQLTFFRRSLTPIAAERTSEWGSNQLYFAHFTLTDAAHNTFYPHERFSRGGAELAGGQSVPYQVWLEDWRATEIEPGVVQLQAREGEVALDLRIEPLKPVVLQGDRGFSPKSDEPGNASYYYSFTRNQAEGTIQTPDGLATVSGFVWKDHEWSTSALGPNAEGWDWFSLQLDDGREMMYFQIRNADGSIEPVSDGVIVEADGRALPLALGDVQVEALDFWQSKTSGARYPAKWRVVVPSAQVDVTLTPLVNNQELNLFFTYWEGAVRIEGSQSGFGYVEMTGYSRTMQGVF